jgi:Tol biopolymer transport system component
MARARWLSALMAILGWLLVVPAAWATYPGHNGLIAFSALTGDHQQIYTIRPNGHDMRQLTAYADADAWYPDWSPDGRRIAFEVDYPDHCSIATMNADGGDVAELTGQANVCDATPTFTPDGRRIMFSHFDGTTSGAALWSMDLTGGDQRLVATAADYNPTVSPDGTRVSVIQQPDTGGAALWVADVAGGAAQQLLSPDWAISVKHDWSPDGRHLLIAPHGLNSDPDHPSNIATIRPDGSDLRYLTHNTDPGVHLLPGTYSPDGRYILFRRDEDRTDRSTLLEMRCDGTHVKVVRDGFSASGFKPRQIDWGPAPRGDRHDL